MPIPLYIDDCNQHMGGVDVADQLRSYYKTNLLHFVHGGQQSDTTVASAFQDMPCDAQGEQTLPKTENQTPPPV